MNEYLIKTLNIFTENHYYLNKNSSFLAEISDDFVKNQNINVATEQPSRFFMVILE